MAKVSNKNLSTINASLKSQLSELRKSTVDSLGDRITKLEGELRDSITLAMSMIAVNKELINRIQDEQPSKVKTPKEGPVTDKDTSTDIVSKIYSFFVKGSEKDKRRYEIERDFAEERMMESKRRKTSRKKTATRFDPKKPSSNPIMDLLGFIGKGIGGIFTFITGGLFNALTKSIGGFKDFVLKGIYKIPVIGSIMKLGVGVFDNIFSTLGFLGNTIKSILSVVTGLGGFVVSMTYKILKTAGGLIFRVIWPVLSTILEKAFGAAGVLTRGVSGIITNPLGALASAGIVAYEAFKEGGALDQEERLYFGDEVFELKKRKIQLQKELDRSAGTGVNPERDASRRKEIAEIDAKLPAAYDKYLNDVVTPAMESAGYKKEIVYDTSDPGGPGIVAFNRINEKGDNEQVKYRGAGESKDRGGDLRYNLTSTEERFSPKTVASTADQAIIEKNIAGEKISQGLGQKAESVKSNLISSASQGISDLSGGAISESSVKEGFSKLNNLISSPSTTTPVTNDVPAPTTSPISAPSATVAPLEQRESDSASITPETTQPSSITPATTAPRSLPSLSDLSDDIDVGRTEVVNLPSQATASTSQTEYTGPTNVRNPNPVVYRTAMYNDQAQP